jgi:hypothetical protein
MALQHSGFRVRDVVVYGAIIAVALALVLFAMQSLFPPKAQDVKIVSTPTSLEMKVGETYRYDDDGVVEAEGGAGFTWRCEGSPSGMQIDADGRIAWTPVKSGLYDLKVQVTNDSDRSDKQEWQVKVIGPPVIKDPGVLKCKPKTPFTYRLEDLSYPKCDAFEIVSDSPPKGLILDMAMGEFRWTPEETGDHTVRIKARNAAGETDLDVKFRVAVELPKKAEQLVEKAKQTVKKTAKRREERSQVAQKDKTEVEKQAAEIKEKPEKDAAAAVAASVQARKAAVERQSAAEKDQKDLEKLQEQIVKKIPEEKDAQKAQELKAVKTEVQEEKTSVEKEIPVRKDETDLFQKMLDEVAEQKKRQIEEKIKAENKAREERKKEAERLEQNIKVREDEHKEAPEKQTTAHMTEQLEDYARMKKIEDTARKQAQGENLKPEEKGIEIIERADPERVPKAIQEAIEQIAREKEQAAKEQKEMADKKKAAYEAFVKYREAMKEKDVSRKGTKPTRKSTLNEKNLLQDGSQHYSVTDAKKLLKKRDLELVLVWHDNQIPELMEAFSGFGCAFLFLPPGGVIHGQKIFLVEGKPDFDSTVREVSASDFFGNFSLKYLLLSDDPGSFRQQVEEALLKKVTDHCPECSSYEMRLFISYPFYTRVLDEARAFAGARGLDLEKDVARVRWILKKWGDDGRLQVVSVEAFDGRRFSADE